MPLTTEMCCVFIFHIDYFKPEKNVTAGSIEHKTAVANAIIKKHDSATHSKRFNAVLATASINDAIEYYKLFKEIQEKRIKEDETYIPLDIACVFSPPAEGNKDVQQLQEDLQQEKEDNKVEPEKKKKALQAIIADPYLIFY
jgi:type I restriction enzyme R subunit